MQAACWFCKQVAWTGPETLVIIGDSHINGHTPLLSRLNDYYNKFSVLPLRHVDTRNYPYRATFSKPPGFIPTSFAGFPSWLAYMEDFLKKNKPNVILWGAYYSKFYSTDFDFTDTFRMLASTADKVFILQDNPAFGASDYGREDPKRFFASQQQMLAEDAILVENSREIERKAVENNIRKAIAKIGNSQIVFLETEHLFIDAHRKLMPFDRSKSQISAFLKM